VIFVVDAADEAGHVSGEARRELHDLMARASLSALPLLVLCNKCDLPGAVSSGDMVDVLALKDLKEREVRRRKWGLRGLRERDCELGAFLSMTPLFENEGLYDPLCLCSPISPPPPGDCVFGIVSDRGEH
jgi:hypothetical protein